MTEEAQDTPQEETQDTPVAPPTPVVSDASPPVASPQPTVDVDAIADRVVEKLDESGVLDRKVHQRFQATTDKSFADVRTVAEYLRKADGDEDLALRNMQIDYVIEQQQSSEGPVGAVSKEELDAQIEADTTLILDGAGIAYNDPRYIALYEKYKDRISHPAVWKGVLETAVEQWAKQESASPAAIVGEGGGTPPPTASDEVQLRKEYEERLAEIRQGDVRSITKLKEEMRKRGLAVW